MLLGPQRWKLLRVALQSRCPGGKQAGLWAPLCCKGGLQMQLAQRRVEEALGR